MKIYFRTHSKARITEHLSIEAPGDWNQLSKPERRRWLADNLDAAVVHGTEAHAHKDTVVLDFQGSWPYIPNSTAAGVSGAGAGLGSEAGSGSTMGSGAGS